MQNLKEDGKKSVLEKEKILKNSCGGGKSLKYVDKNLMHVDKNLKYFDNGFYCRENQGSNEKKTNFQFNYGQQRRFLSTKCEFC